MLDVSLLPITCENTRLRQFSELDAEAYAAGTRDEVVRRFGHLPEPTYTPESVRRMIREEVAEGLSSSITASRSATWHCDSPTPSTARPRSGGFSTRHTAGTASPAKPSGQCLPSGSTTTGSTASLRRSMPATALPQHSLAASDSGSKRITSRTGSVRANGPTPSSMRGLRPRDCNTHRKTDSRTPRRLNSINSEAEQFRDSGHRALPGRERGVLPPRSTCPSIAGGSNAPAATCR